MKKIIAHLLIYFLISSPFYAQKDLGLFDNAVDIGECLHQGFSIYNSEDQTYTLGGSGSNMWFGKDNFHYLWSTIQGDFILRAEVKFLGNGVDPHRKVGWIVKNDLRSNSEHVNASVHGDGLTALQYRKEADGDTEEINSVDTFPTIIQLERRGVNFIMSTAANGKEFTTVNVEGSFINNEAYIGLYICSHNEDILETANFRNVRIIKPVNPDYQPYRDYIGSNLEVMDIKSGNRKILYRSAHSIQAPNWTVDGEKLIYNSKGLLYNYDLNSSEITPLNTGFAIRNNNDHVLTFDGKLLGISHHNPENDGNSSLYYLPVDGSETPIPVTKSGKPASYLHGWSPDNKKMVFTGNRNGQYDIYSVDIETGKEIQLTDFSTLDDGPEYSPDGKYIFFNSVRTGTMQLWRMDADGQNQTQLTFDEYNDWFPHVSPNMKWIIYISFPKDINPSDHPFYKHCLLKIMPYNGGESKIIAQLYGGQGTINVPSWSPDSKKIAFVSNTDF